MTKGISKTKEQLIAEAAARSGRSVEALTAMLKEGAAKAAEYNQSTTQKD